MAENDLRNKLMGVKLKITPQRMAVLNAIEKLYKHPIAEKITEYVKRDNPNIAIWKIC